MALLTVPEIKGGLAGHKQQLGVFGAALDTIVGPGERIAHAHAKALEKCFVLLIGNVAFRPGP